MAEQSAVLQRLNKLCRMVGIGDSIDDPIVVKPTLTHREFAERIELLIRRTGVITEGQGNKCSTRQQLQQ